MNPERERQIEEARDHIDSGWNDERARQALARVKRGYARRRTAKVAGAIAAIVAVCVALPIILDQLKPATVPFHDDIELSANRIELADEVAITPLENASAVTVSEVTDQQIRLKMEEGRAHFDIDAVAGNNYVIAAGAVEIEVVGTSFDVERRSKEVTISVHEGTVAVRSELLGQAFLLRDGESRTIELPEDTEVAAELAPAEVDRNVDESPSVKPSESESSLETAPSETGAPPKAAEDTPKKWREMTKRKDFQGASKLIMEDPKVVDRNAVDELFDAADAMRRAGHHDQAADYLGTIVEEHLTDSRAALAAHTRGRILMRRLDEPCRAAESFARAQSIGLDGMLQRDALANEAESLIACGKVERANDRLDVYRTNYPNGPHLESLERPARPAEK